MAYAKRLQIEYDDINSVATRIEVWQDGYTGSVVQRNYASGNVCCEVVWGNPGLKELPLVYGSKATLYFDSETNFEFHDFFTSNSRKNKILVYKNEALFHCSFGEADTWSELYSYPPYEVSFTGFDGLGQLKKTAFVDNSGDDYEGEKTPLQILQIILEKTGLDLAFNTAVGIRPEGFSTSADALTQTLKDVESYKGMNCYDVLEALFRGCRILQRGGEWYVISNDKWQSASFSCYSYTAAGVANGTKTVTSDFINTWMEGDGELNFKPAVKQLKVTQNYGYRGTMVQNNNFEFFEDGVFANWEAVGVAPYQRIYDADGNRYAYLPGVEDLGNWRDYVRTKYIRTSAIRMEQTTSVPSLSVDFALMGATGKSGIILIGVHLIADSGTHYNLKADLNDDNEIIHVWEETTGLYAVPVDDFVREYTTGYFSHKEVHHYASANKTEAYPSDEVIDHFQTKNIQIKEGVPEGGTLRIYLFLAQASASGIGGACFRNIEFNFLDQDEEELPLETEFNIINDSDNNYVPSDIKLPNGTLPAIPNSLSIYNGGFIKNDGSGDACENWVVDGHATAVSYAKLIGLIMVSEMRLARNEHNTVLADQVPGTSLLFEDALLSKRFLECGIKYNDRMQTIDGSYVELLSLDIASITSRDENVYLTPRPSDYAGRRSTGTTSTSNDEVGLYNDDNQRVGRTGRLSNRDFTDIEDDESGRVVLQETIVTKIVDQEAHSFVVGEAIRFDGTTEAYMLAQADTKEHASVIGIVSEVYSADSFAYKVGGTLYDDSTYAAGEVYMLSPSTAGLVTTIPTTYVWGDDEVQKVIGIAGHDGLVINIDELKGEGDTGSTTIITGNATITETPAGTANGTNTDFTLSQTPSTGSVRVYLNGIRQRPTTDYTISGSVITFTTAPYSGDDILVDYHASSITTIYGETPTGTINGTNTDFTLSNTPATVKVYLNGVRQRPTTDYSVSGAVITFINAPYTGDNILVDYEM